MTYDECVNKALWLIDNGYSNEPFKELAEKLFVINNKSEKEKDGNPSLSLNNNN